MFVLKGTLFGLSEGFICLNTFVHSAELSFLVLQSHFNEESLAPNRLSRACLDFGLS